MALQNKNSNNSEGGKTIMAEQNENTSKINASQAGTVDLSNLDFSGQHWPDIKFNNHLMMDALAKHCLGLAYYGMTDIGEIFEILVHLKPGDEECWISTWGALAQRLQDRAEKAEKVGKLVSASTAYLRASSYWRFSVMNFSKPEDSRMRNYSLASTSCYEKYLKLSGYPGEYIEIPYENSFLPGHFYRSPVAKGNAPLLVITPGRDTFAEDTRWVYDGAIRRGIHCIIFDGPGQGFALRLNNLVFRNDWENVVGPVIDCALKFPGIDSSRIGLMGLSMGGYLVARAASFDKRIKVCVTDPGNISWGDMINGRLQMVSQLPPDKIPEMLKGLVKDYAWKHGVPNTINDVIQALKKYDNSSIVDKITCQTLVLDGTGEMNPGTAKKFFDALKCPKDYMLFDETTTAQAHTQMGSYATATEYLFDWLEDRL